MWTHAIVENVSHQRAAERALRRKEGRWVVQWPGVAVTSQMAICLFIYLFSREHGYSANVCVGPLQVLWPGRRTGEFKLT